MSQTTSIQNNGIIIYVYSDPSTQGKGVIQVMADHPVASTLAISLDIQYGVSSGSYSHGSITVKKGNLSPSDFSGGILIELILGNKINGYVKRVMLRIKVN